MKIVIAGGHGQIALFLGEQLAAAGHQPQGLIRKAEQGSELNERGIEPVLLDLERIDSAELATALSGADAVVFAAGAGPNSGIARKDAVDRAGSVLLADAAVAAGVPRFVQISSMGAESVRGGAHPEGMDTEFHAYLIAKLAAEDDLRSRDALDWTIVRPGRLTDEAPSGRVLLADTTGRGSVPRADVAAVVAELLQTGAASGRVLELIAGDTPVSEAVAAFDGQ
ncbi:nucleoside-diphosphate-sugar epimerase [Psychromicrobium silvestre]|uniref:Nucleoside-diphosphate-sugar epimerase n=1 Tax=Psychromicrobium silvestre TaxID=1645614 RepID=A0A7Y9S538_9MICC|nr:SDR family oxidoreductase [Psychromicrobium silvestre]NYE93816.1 nucleoside-diphosphate-sugar epimerase [Psychromicrobium silvestre]